MPVLDAVRAHMPGQQIRIRHSAVFRRQVAGGDRVKFLVQAPYDWHDAVPQGVPESAIASPYGVATHTISSILLDSSSVTFALSMISCL